MRLRHATPGLCLLAVLATGALAQEKPGDTTVVVKGKKAPVTHRIDGTVYDESQNPKAATGTAADVLKTVPQVSVSPEGEVKLRGDGNVQVYVNGKPAAEMAPESRAATLLTMPGGDIASVEVITNPSAKYDANGGGIINIVLKKNRKPGAGGLINANAADFGRHNLTASGHYTRGRLSLNTTLSFRHDGSPKSQGSDTTWLDPAGAALGRSVQASRAFVRRVTTTASASLDYDLGDAGTLTFSARHAEHHSRNPIIERHQDYDAGGLLADDYDRLSNGPNTQSDDSLTLTWDRHAPDGSELKLQAAHSLSIATRDKSYRNRFRAPVQPDGGDRVLYKLGRRLDEVSGDYVRPFGETIQVSAGFDLQDENDPSWNDYAAVDPATGQETVDAGRTNRFAVRRQQAAAYVTWQGGFGPWTVLAGARLESLRTTGDQITAGTKHRSRYGNLNPSLHLSYAIDTRRQLKASFSRSLQRPDAAALNPFLVYVDAQNSTLGNPDLKPQRVTSAEVEYDYSFDPLSYSLTLYDRSSDRTVTDYGYLTAGNVLVTTKRNASSGRSLGADYNLNGKIGPHLGYRFDLNLFHVRLQATDTGGILRQSGTSWTSSGGLDYDADSGDSLSLDITAQGRSLTSQGWRSGTSSVDLSWSHPLSPRLTFVASASNVFADSLQAFVTTTATIRQTGYSDFHDRIVYAGLRWTFGRKGN